MIPKGILHLERRLPAILKDTENGLHGTSRDLFNRLFNHFRELDRQVKELETQIKTSLNALLAAIKASDGQTISDEMARLDDYLERGRAGLHPQLIHFLENRSYAKALMFLGGETNIPVGACGGRAGKP